MSDSRSENAAMARLRFEAIAPLLGVAEGQTLRQRLEARSRDWFRLPDARQKRYSWMTLEDWLYRYRHGGLEALTNAPRQDWGRFRVLTPALVEELGRLLSAAPRLKSSNLLRELARREVWDGHHPSRSVLYRYVKTARGEYLVAGVEAERERRDFEAHYANQLWQADIMYGPLLPHLQSDGRIRREKTYLIAIIDDYSRLICHAEFGFSQNLTAWLAVLKKACRKRGIPDKLYCDNGKVFRSEQIARISAVIGTLLSFTQVRDAAAKGKIERFFKRLRAQFLEVQMLLVKPRTLAELNAAFAQWLETDYNRSPHRGIDQQTPNTRWLQRANHVRHLPDEVLQRAFRFQVTRKVNKTGSFTLNGKRYETASALVGKKVELYYDPSLDAAPEVTFEGKSYGHAAAVDRAGNLNRHRRSGNSTKEQA